MFEHHETAKHFVDISAAGSVIATLAGWMPNIAAFFSTVWFLIRIWESDTVKSLTGRK